MTIFINHDRFWTGGGDDTKAGLVTGVKRAERARRGEGAEVAGKRLVVVAAGVRRPVNAFCMEAGDSIVSLAFILFVY